MNHIMSFKCLNGTLKVYEEKIVIIRNGLFSFLSFNGFTGDKTYFYKNIIGVEFKEPKRFIDGYIKFIISGIDSKIKTGLFFPSALTFSDKNTLILNKFSKNECKIIEIHKFIVNKISNLNNQI